MCYDQNIYREKEFESRSRSVISAEAHFSEYSTSLPNEAGESDEAIEAVPGRGEVLSKQCCQLLARFPGRMAPPKSFVAFNKPSI
jgi:hypothetical protein